MSEPELPEAPAEPATGEKCPACAGVVVATAARCPHCGILLKDWVACPECLERIPAGARACRWCGARRPKPPPIPQLNSNAAASPLQQPAPSLSPMPKPVPAPDIGSMRVDPLSVGEGRPPLDLTIGTTPIGGFLCNRSITALFKPPEFRLHEDEVVARSWYSFGLRHDEDRLPLRRIASVRLTSGVFWSSIYVEAAGSQGGNIQIHGLKKKEARDLLVVLEQQVLELSRILTRPKSDTTQTPTAN
jgi:hypothetical protein